MLLVNVITFSLLAFSVYTAPVSPSQEPRPPEDDPLETAESGHFRRKRFWKTLLKHLYGLGSYGLGAYGLGGQGLDLLSSVGHFHKHQHGHHGGGHGGGGHGSKGHDVYGGGSLPIKDYHENPFGGHLEALPEGYGSTFHNDLSLDLGPWGVLDGYGWGMFGSTCYF